MGETRDIMNNIMQGLIPVERLHPEEGQSKYYYYDPRGTTPMTPFSKLKTIDVPTKDTPNPIFQQNYRPKHLSSHTVSSAATPVFQQNYLPGGLPTQQKRYPQPSAKDASEDDLSMKEYAQYATAKGLQGLTYGFSDEGLGALNAAKEGWNAWRNDQDPLEAARRGYIDARDEHRAFLKEAEQRAPKVSMLAETVGAIASPGKFLAVAKTAPRAAKIATNLKNSTIGGMLYGYGDGEGEINDHIASTIAGSLGGFAGGCLGNKFSKSFLPAFTNPTTKPAFVKTVSTIGSNMVTNGLENLNSYFSEKY